MLWVMLDFSSCLHTEISCLWPWQERPWSLGRAGGEQVPSWCLDPQEQSSARLSALGSHLTQLRGGMGDLAVEEPSCRLKPAPCSCLAPRHQAWLGTHYLPAWHPQAQLLPCHSTRVRNHHLQRGICPALGDTVRKGPALPVLTFTRACCPRSPCTALACPKTSSFGPNSAPTNQVPVHQQNSQGEQKRKPNAPRMGSR